MPGKSQLTVRIIDGLAEITRHHDRNIVEKSLLKTVRDLISGDTRLYRVEKNNNNTDFNLLAFAENGQFGSLSDSEKHSAPMTDALEEVLNSGQMLSRPHTASKSPSDTLLYDNIYPAYDAEEQIFAVLIHTGKRSDAAEERLVQGVLTVYANYLILIEKTKRDKLTGLFNRETLNYELNKTLFSSHSSPIHPSSSVPSLPDRRSVANEFAFVGIIDIDHFKGVNDRFGHLFGDEILIIISRLLTEHFSRQEDMVFRYGGEEFVVIIHATNLEGATSIFERLRHKVESHSFPQINDLTISIGFTKTKQQQTTADLLDEADQSLYYAKENGRNRLCYYENLVDEGSIENKKTMHYGEVKLF